MGAEERYPILSLHVRDLGLLSWEELCCLKLSYPGEPHRVFQNREFRKHNTIQGTWLSPFIASGSETLLSAGHSGIGRLEGKRLKSQVPHRLCFPFQRWLQQLQTSLEFDSHLRSAYCLTSHTTYLPFLAVESETRERPTATPHQKGIHYLESMRRTKPDLHLWRFTCSDCFPSPYVGWHQQFR